MIYIFVVRLKHKRYLCVVFSGVDFCKKKKRFLTHVKQLHAIGTYRQPHAIANG